MTSSQLTQNRVSFGNDDNSTFINLERVRPQTGIQDSKTSSILKYANQENKPSARLGTSSSREDFRAKAKAKRDAELRAIEREELETQRQEEKEISIKEKIVERNRSHSKSRKSSQSPSPKKGAGGFEDDDDDDY